MKVSCDDRSYLCSLWYMKRSCLMVTRREDACVRAGRSCVRAQGLRVRRDNHCVRKAGVRGKGGLESSSTKLYQLPCIVFIVQQTSMKYLTYERYQYKYDQHLTRTPGNTNSPYTSDHSTHYTPSSINLHNNNSLSKRQQIIQHASITAIIQALIRRATR